MTFLANLVNRTLPVSREAMDMTASILEETRIANEWMVRGKTGMTYPRKPDYTFDREHPRGWFVGWAEKDGRTVIFMPLVQDD